MLIWHSPLIQNYALTHLLLMPCSRRFHNICVKSHRPCEQHLLQCRSRCVADETETVKLWSSFSRLQLHSRILRWFISIPTSWTSPILQVKVRSKEECCYQAGSSVLASISKEGQSQHTLEKKKKKQTPPKTTCNV